MKITNIDKLEGEKLTIYGCEMVYSKPIRIGETGFEVNLCDGLDTHIGLFSITLNSHLNSLLVLDLQNKNEELGNIKKEDVNSIENFGKTVSNLILKLPTIGSFLMLLKTIQDAKMGLAAAQTNAKINATNYYSTSLPISNSFSHLSGSLGQPINPNKPKYMSKGTAKMPVTMSVDDNEIW